MACLDPHSYHDPSQPVLQFVEWQADVDFLSRTLNCVATLQFNGAGPVDLDTRDLEIRTITDPSGAPLPYEWGEPDPILGRRLRVVVPHACVITYRTSPDASALQWLAPEQTRGAHPFLFSQCQAIHARSLLPLQDTPSVRIRYRARLTVPVALRALMAASFCARTEDGGRATETWEANLPIPPYLLAFAVGELVSQELGPRSRVWAEPAIVAQAAWEFAGVEEMIRTAESLFGPYDWGRFDLLTMPPSFPYGGMENPQLTFLTPTLLAGDRSLVNVVAHELAHAWTGNLVTNASAEHFWLNEGFTVYAERRLLEALEGAELAGLHAAVGRQELERALARFADRPELTRLHVPLAGVDPDDAFSSVPYEKGYLLLRCIERAVGRPAFDAFLQSYIRHFRFRSITTDDFVAFLATQLPGVADAVGLSRWLEEPGLPDNAPEARSERLEQVRAIADNLPPVEQAQAWGSTEWQLYLEGLPRTTTLCPVLATRFRLTDSRNHEILVSWLTLCIEAGYLAVLPRVEDVLCSVGRMKYLRPLYTALARNPQTLDFARRVFTQCQSHYHPIGRQMVERLLAVAKP